MTGEVDILSSKDKEKIIETLESELHEKKDHPLTGTMMAILSLYKSDLQELKALAGKLDSEMEKIKQDVSATKSELHELKVSISGNKATGIKGFAERLATVEKEKDVNKADIAKMKNDLRWYGIIATAVATIVSVVVANWKSIFG